jgi:dienelactone hydrolase
VATAAKLPQPMFIAWGDKDLKVIPDDWAGWKAKLGEKPSLTYKTYPGLQHLFTPVGTPEVGHVAKDVIEDLAKWCAK